MQTGVWGGIKGSSCRVLRSGDPAGASIFSPWYRRTTGLSLGRLQQERLPVASAACPHHQAAKSGCCPCAKVIWVL